ncbi:uncharacterized protein LOC132194051 [Neocloeon triangulifer]|uniref:uncharacterized protein LOC132194051 n=1 Tax=Neocloeon triangulifer TaxID=2078957 RepID=UPI00286F3FE3|nr:uncharacterized protein LOC132194051 [Neocloeon triangulifer]
MAPTAPQILVFLLSVCLLLQVASSAAKGKACQFADIEACGKNEMCVQSVNKGSDGVCQCIPGYGRNQGECVGEHPVPSTTPGSLPTASPHTNGPDRHDAVVGHILVPVLLVLTLVIVLVYLGHRYNWPARARLLAQRAMASRRTNDVLIRGPDDDDDPIA